MSRNYNKQQLCDAVFQAVAQSTQPPTRLEICTSIGRKKSPHVLDMISHLVNTGWLVEYSDRDNIGRTAFRYRIEQSGQPNCREVAV